MQGGKNMPLPESLLGDSWTKRTARAILPLLIWLAKNGKTITYGQLDREVVERGWGHHVPAIMYGHPAGAIGNALIETEGDWGITIPPINALVINQKTQLPGEGINWYIERYVGLDEHIDFNDMSIDKKKAIVEEIHQDIFSFEYWDDIINEYELEPFESELRSEHENDIIATPSRGGWSRETESAEHKKLKEYIANNPDIVGLNAREVKVILEYIFPTTDQADIVFKNDSHFLGVEVKSIISNDDDINRGIFQCVKYQALLRAEQKALRLLPTARAILVVERELPLELQNLADIFEIRVVIHRVNK